MPRRLSLLVAFLILGSPVQAQDLPQGYDEGLFELVLQRTDTRLTLRTLVDPRGTVLLPLLPVLLGTGIPTVDTGDALVLEWPPATWNTTLDRARRTLTIGTNTEPLDPADWVILGGEIFASTDALSALLHTGIQVSFENLIVAIEENPDFPVIRRAQIEIQRARARTRAESVADSTSYPARTGGLAASWGVSVLEASGGTSASARAATGAAVLGGSLEAGGTLAFADAAPTTFDGTWARWARVFPANPWLRQFQMGSVFGDGPAGRRVIGISITNAPLNTPSFFDDALIEPTVPAGWEYEIYQGDYLVGVGNRETSGGVTTALDYGNTPVRVRMVGPAGQEITQELVFVVRPGMVPAGEWRHAFGGGACADDGCDDYAWAELRHGVSSRLTAGLGIDRLTPEDSTTLWRPYAFLGANPLRNLSAELHAQPDALVRSNLLLQGAGGRSASAGYTWFDAPDDAPGGWSAQFSATSPVAMLDRRTVNARLLLRGTEPGTVDLWQAAASAAFRSVFTTLEYESGFQRRDLVTTRAYAILPRTAGLRDGAVSLSLGASSAGAELLETGFAFRPLTGTSASASLRFRRGTEPTFTIGFVTRLSAAYTQSRASTGPDGTSLFLSADGGLATGAQNGVELLPYESIGRAGVSGLVFLDNNGDGRFGPGDTPAPDVNIHVGTARVTSDPNGAWRAWQLEPYEPIAIAVDSLSTPVVAWLPQPERILVRPTPNLFTRVDLPLVPTRELSGHVPASPEFPATGGIAIVISRADGSTAAETRTFSDGVFYLPRLRPGVYSATIAPASLAALGAAAEPIPFTLDTAGAHSLELPPFHLTPIR